jgi:ABC-2 type transport system permease protein
MSSYALPRRLGARLGIGDAGRFVTVVATLAVAQFRLRYLDAALSFLWAIARPAFFFGVMWAVFTHVTRVGNGVHHYAAYLFTTIVLWNFFGESTGSAATSLVQYGGLLRKIPVPPLAIPLATALTSLFDLVMSMSAVVVFVLLSGVTPRLSWLEVPVLVGILMLLVSGFGMLLSVLYVRFRDVDQIWIVCRQALFYVSPIFYVLASLPNGVERLALVNPLAAIFTEMRHALLDPSAPSAAAAAGGWLHLLPAFGIVVAVVAAGLYAFVHTNPWLAERL